MCSNAVILNLCLGGGVVCARTRVCVRILNLDIPRPFIGYAQVECEIELSRPRHLPIHTAPTHLPTHLRTHPPIGSQPASR